MYFADRYKKFNGDNIKHKFYSDASFEVRISLCVDCEGNDKLPKFQIGPSEEGFRNYTYYELDFYGMARRGNTWRGNRMIR